MCVLRFARYARSAAVLRTSPFTTIPRHPTKSCGARSLGEHRLDKPDQVSSILTPRTASTWRNGKRNRLKPGHLGVRLSPWTPLFQALSCHRGGMADAAG